MADEKVKHVSTTIVKPTGIKEERTELTPSDLSGLRRPYGQRGLLFTKPKQDQTTTICHIITNLKTSLSHTLDYFYPLAGRLAIDKHDDGTISFYINCNPAGAEFVHATANVKIDDILNSTYTHPLVNSFFSQNGVMNYEGLTRPLLSVQVTELIDGIFIGCSINHSVCDGTSFWHFFNSWSEISMGSDLISGIPVFKRLCPNDNETPIHLPSDTLQKFDLPPKEYTDPIEQKVFYFKSDNIAILKAKANSESWEDGKNGTTSIISSLQALLGYVWVAVARAKCLDLNEEITLSIAIGSRGRLDPPLAQEYFGNAVVSGIAKAKVGELLERGPCWGAFLINQSVKSMKDAEIRSFWKSWMENPSMRSLDECVAPTRMRAGASPRFNMYGNDFGWGRPVAMRNGGSYRFLGKMSGVPGPVEGVVGIEVCLPVETLESMEADYDFMELVSEFKEHH